MENRETMDAWNDYVEKNDLKPIMSLDKEYVSLTRALDILLTGI